MEDGYRAARSDHWLSSGRVLMLAVPVGDEESRGLILFDIFEAEPEVELAVATVGFGGRQQRVVAIVDVERPTLAARIGDQTQSGPIVYLVGVEPAAGKGDALAVDDGAVEALFGIGKIAGADAVVGWVVRDLVPRFENAAESGGHFRALGFGEVVMDDDVAARGKRFEYFVV